MKIITASEARIIFGRENRTSVERFNRLVMDAISKKKNVICLPVETTTDNFIARVKKAKFSVGIASDCYIISWKSKKQVYTSPYQFDSVSGDQNKI